MVYVTTPHTSKRSSGVTSTGSNSSLEGMSHTAPGVSVYAFEGEVAVEAAYGQVAVARLEGAVYHQYVVARLYAFVCHRIARDTRP